MVPGILRLGVAGVIMGTAQMAGFTAISFFAGMLPNAGTVLAANAIFTTILFVSNTALAGMCAAGAIRIGNALGAGQARRAATLSRLVVWIIISTAGLSAFIAWAVCDALARTYTDDAATLALTRRLVHSLFPLIALFGISNGVQSIFQGCGMQTVNAKLSLASLLLLSLPLGYAFAFVLDGGVLGLWFGNLVGTVAFVLGAGMWLFGVDWEEMAEIAWRNTHVHAVDKGDQLDSTRKAEAC